MNVPSSNSFYQTAYNQNGYGGMAYYTSETCGYVNGNYVDTGCTIDYSQSEIKYVVDAWKLAKTPAALYTRLITIDDLIDNLGYSWDITSDGKPVVNDDVPVWVYNNNYSYLTIREISSGYVL